MTMRPGTYVDLDGRHWVVDEIEVDVELGLAAVWLLAAPVVVDEDGTQTFLDARCEVFDLG